MATKAQAIPKGHHTVTPSLVVADAAKAIEFYKKMGAVPMDEWTVFRVAGAALERLAAE